MSQSLKRGLRERPKRRNFDSDVKGCLSKNEEGQHYSYIKSYSKEFVNPSQQLNQDAKLLIKFINNANKSYSEHLHLAADRQNDAPKPTHSSTTKSRARDDVPKDTAKKNTEASKPMESEPIRKGKQIYSNNGQNKGYQKFSNHKNQDFLNKIKGMALASASSMLELEKSLGKNQASNSQGKQKNQGNSNPKTKPEPNNYYVVRGKQKNGVTQMDKSLSKFQLTEQKIFKRSAYHVAIAYHIFLSQKSKEGTSDASAFDPTYPARKLKDQITK